MTVQARSRVEKTLFFKERKEEREGKTKTTTTTTTKQTHKKLNHD